MDGRYGTRLTCNVNLTIDDITDDTIEFIVIASRHLLKKVAVNTIRVGDCHVNKVDIVWMVGLMTNLLWPYTLPKHAVCPSITYTTLGASGNIYQLMQLRLLFTLLLVAEKTSVTVYYMVCLSTNWTSYREFKTLPPGLSSCRANFVILLQPSVTLVTCFIPYKL